MIDEKTQAQLRAKYNPEGSLLRQHQLRMLEMLKHFDAVCQKHGIRYWLSSGNCIGAARHGGFIPWDDDIDVEMLREDYLKLMKVFKETDDYVLQTWKNDEYYVFSYAKMRDKHSYIEEDKIDKLYKYKGVYIDVFCMEMTPKTISRLYNALLWRWIVPLRNSTGSIGKKLYKISRSIYFSSIGMARFLFGWLPNNKLRHTYGVTWINNTRNIDKIFPLQRVLFDGIEVNVPNDIDSYLRNIYGDYMKLPTEDKIRKPHVSKIEIW